MAYSYVNYIGDGSQANWTFKFPYLDPTNVYATVNGQRWYFDFAAPNTAQLIPTPPAGTNIQIFRDTVSGATPNQWTDGSVLRDKDLNRLALFCLYCAQEQEDKDNINGGGIGDGLGLTMPEILEGLTGKLELDQFALDLVAEIGKISGPEEVIGSVAYKILQESLAREAAILAEAQARQAAITQVTTVQQGVNSSLAQQITDLTASVGNDGSAAAIEEERTARVDADGSLAQSISTLAAQTTSNIHAAVATEAQARTDGDSANAILISNLTSTVGANAALVVNESQTRATADTALASRAGVLEATTAGMGGKTVMALIADEASARTTADSANASATSTLQSSVNALGNTLATVQTQANTSVTNLGVVNANYTLKTQALSNGKLAVAGIGLNSTATNTTAQSEIIFAADKFQFISTIGGLAETPQGLLQLGVVSGVNTLVLAPVTIGDQTIAARMVVDGSLTALKIDTRGLSIKDLSGNVILSAGNPLDASHITASSAWLNSNVSIGTNGVLNGGGGGQVTIGGLGYTGAMNATTDITLIGRNGCVVSGNTITKSASGSSGWDADAYSVESYVGGAYASAVVPSSTVASGWSVMFGINDDPLTDSSYTSLNCAWYVSGANLSIYEGGTQVLSGLTVAGGDILLITYDGVTVTYYQNGVVRRSFGASAGQRLYFDSSFYSPGSSLSNCRFGPMTSVAAATAAASTAQSTADSANSTAGAAQSTANAAAAAAADRLSKSANSILSATVGIDAVAGAGFVAGNLTWNASGVRTGGYGVAMTPGGLVGYNTSGVNTFSINASNGNAYFGGTLAAGIATKGTASASLSSNTTITGSASLVYSGLINGFTYSVGSGDLLLICNINAFLNVGSNVATSFILTLYADGTSLFTSSGGANPQPIIVLPLSNVKIGGSAYSWSASNNFDLTLLIPAGTLSAGSHTFGVSVEAFYYNSSGGSTSVTGNVLTTNGQMKIREFIA